MLNHQFPQNFLWFSVDFPRKTIQKFPPPPPPEGSTWVGIAARHGEGLPAARLAIREDAHLGCRRIGRIEGRILWRRYTGKV